MTFDDPTRPVIAAYVAGVVLRSFSIRHECSGIEPPYTRSQAVPDAWIAT